MRRPRGLRSWRRRVRRSMSARAFLMIAGCLLDWLGWHGTGMGIDWVGTAVHGLMPREMIHTESNTLQPLLECSPYWQSLLLSRR